MLDEKWVWVVGYEGYYEVSTCGRVRSVPRTVPMRNGRSKKMKGKMINIRPNPVNGYLQVNLNINSIGTTYKVHRLVAFAFFGLPPTEKHQVRHLDGNCQNNKVSNLAWGTAVENYKDKILHQTAPIYTHCPKGHPLEAPNLQPKQKERFGTKRCWACNKASSRTSKIPEARLHEQWASDAYLARILKGDNTRYDDFKRDLFLHVSQCAECPNKTKRIRRMK